MAKQLGQFYDLWMSATSPAAPTTTANYTAVGEVTAVNLEQVRAAIEAANFDSGYDDDSLAGRRTRTLTATAHFDVTPDAGQEVALDQFESVSGAVWFLMFPTSGTTGDNGYHGTGVLTKANIAHEIDAVITMDLEVRVTSLTRFVRA